MGEQEGKETTNSKEASSSSSSSLLLCEECKLKESKYRCPGCSIRSCSLPCVKAHKLRTSCTGKRDHTHFVPLSQFDDNLLISDYNMLEDVKRVAESAQRMRFKLTGFLNFRLPWHLKSLRSAAASRGTRIQFLSSGMSKREKNKSSYDNRKKVISWTIEWRFHPTDVVLIDHGVLESTNLCSVIENHLKPGPWNHKLKLFCEEPPESLKFFIRKYYKGQRSPFLQLDINAPIREQLSNLVLLEYPVIHVFLPSHPINFQVIKDLVPPKRHFKESVPNSELSPKGITFREEEIDDDSSTDPQVLDLMKQVKPNQTLGGPEKEFRPCLTKADQDSEQVVKNDMCVHKGEGDNLNSGSKTEEQGNLESMDFDFDCDFDFEQGLIDTYSDLISETNPDDFLDLEGVFPEEVDLEELEEGEIPGF